MTARHIVLMGLDGVRPDGVTPETTPHLHRLITDGAVMQRHISAFPTETRVNLSTLVTGVTATGHGIVANRFLLPGPGDDGQPVEPGPPATRTRMEADGGVLLARPIGDVLAAAGHELAVLSTGSLGAWNLLRHTNTPNGFAAYNPRFPEHVRPAGLRSRVRGMLDGATDASDGLLSRHLVDVFIDEIWPERRPTFSILWFAEPDNAQHYRGGPGSPGALEGLANVDALVGQLRAWRDEQPERDAIDLVVVSDHGHVTVDARISVVDTLVAGGLKAGRVLDPDVDIAVVGGRGPGLWTRKGDERRLERAMDILIEQPWFGRAFSRGADAATGRGHVPGSFAYDLIGAESRRAASLRIALDATDERNAFDMAGIGAVDMRDDALPIGGGMHGGLHAAETFCLCAAQGPSFASGVASERPSSVADLLPTLLHVLGVDAPTSARGRVLTEMLTTGEAPEAASETTELYETEHGGRTFNLRRRRLGEHAYFDPSD